MRASPWAGWSPRTRSPRPSPTSPARSRAPPPARPWPWTAAWRACAPGRGRADAQKRAASGERGMTKITGFETYDVRFPTSRTLAGSDAMNPAPDYSAAYVVIRTDVEHLAGHGYAFTIGRGNEVQLAAIRVLEPFLTGQDLDEVLGEPGGRCRLGELYRRLVRDSPLHWLGPSCGVVHMATGAVLNACWDLAARRAGKPLWLLLAELTPEQITGLVDFRYLSDALTPDEALGLLERGVAGRAERIAALRRDGYPAYSTAPGWLGYSDERLAVLCAEAVDEGFTHVKLKVGAALQDD